MSQVGNKYYDCEFHSSGPFNGLMSGITLATVETSDEASNKSDDGNVILVEAMSATCQSKEHELPEGIVRMTEKKVPSDKVGSVYIHS